MLKSLHARLSFSHILPVVIIAPIISFMLLYLLETQYFFSNLASELLVQANIVQHFTEQDQTLWDSQSQARNIIRQLKSSIPARVMFLDAKGRLLASSLISDQSRDGNIIQMPVVAAALKGQSDWLTAYNPFIGERVIDVAVPVEDPSGKVIGVIRLSHDLRSIEDKLNPVWGLVFFSLMIAMILAILLALVLAKSLSSPLRHLTQAVSKLSPELPPQPIPEKGPTEVKALAAGFNQLSQRLYETEQNRRSLLASFVHELGTPLGAIKAAAQALQAGAVSDPELGVDLAEGINVEVEQLRRLLDDLVLLGETQVHKLTLKRESIHVGEITEAICRAYAYLVKQKNIQLEYEVDSTLPVIQADSARIHQIISNLLHNAYKYTPSNGRINVRVVTQYENGVPESIHLTVTDNGSGIDATEYQSIFKMFYRSPKQAGNHQGMGIGLALAQQLALAHGGTLTVDNSIHDGASFILRLPVNIN